MDEACGETLRFSGHSKVLDWSLAHRQAEEEVAEFVMQQQRYKMLDADDEEEEDAARAAAEQRRKEERKKHLRRKREEDVDEDEVCLFSYVCVAFLFFVFFPLSSRFREQGEGLKWKF